MTLPGERCDDLECICCWGELHHDCATPYGSASPWTCELCGKTWERVPLEQTALYRFLSVGTRIKFSARHVWQSRT